MITVTYCTDKNSTLRPIIFAMRSISNDAMAKNPAPVANAQEPFLTPSA